MNRLSPTAVLVSVLTATACTDEAVSTPSPTVTVTEPGPTIRVPEPAQVVQPETLEDLRAGLEQAGLDCASWQDVVVQDVSAECDDIILATISDGTPERDSFVRETLYLGWTAARETEEADVAFVVGSNWHVRMYVEQAEALQPFLGGGILA